jgi:acyl-CoA synthetase (AMP-forming)/AMP-acid ligase II
MTAQVLSGGPAPPDPGPLAELLARRGRDGGDRPAVTVANGAAWTSMTWHELDDATAAVAAAGVPAAAGAPVVVALDNSVASMAAMVGLWRAGIDTLVVEATSSSLTDPRSTLWGAGGGTVVAPASPASRVPPLAGIRVLAYEQLLAGPPAAPSATVDHEPVVLQLTSGSLGEPRAAVQPLANILRGGAIYRVVFDLQAASRVVAPIPLAHSFGMVGGMAAALVSGVELVTMTRLRLGRLVEALSIAGAVVLGTPMLYRMVASTLHASGHGGDALAVAAALSSGAPLPPAVAAKVAPLLGGELFQVYGSTETGIIACTYPRRLAWPAETVGAAAPGVTVLLSPGSEAHRLDVLTSTMFTGYADAPRAEGFYDVGDLGRADADGNLFLVGRKDSFVNVGGRKVNPVRAERIIRATGLVHDVAVYGVDRGDGDEEVHAAVEASSPGVVERLRELCRQQLAPYEVPLAFHVVERLPRGALGKVQREQLPAMRGGTDAGSR